MSDLKEWQSGAMDVYVIPQGTAAAPGIQLYGDLDTGLYGFAANQLGVAVGGASAGYFSSAGWVGNVNGTITGDINATTIDTTNLEVTNIKAKDGTAAITIADSTGAVGVSTAVTFSATTQNIALGTSQTTGTFTVGGAAQTGTQTLDQSTKTHTFNVATGATESGATKTVNIATAGVSGSTTTISIGSSVSGATSTTTLSGNVTATRDMTVNGITVGKGKGSEGSNTALGLSALAAFTTGESSTAIGQYALWKATTSAFNTAVGTQSQLNSLTGGYNTSVGALTLNTATASSFNVAIGFSALNLATGDNNTAVGNSAGSLITTGAKNTIIGNYTGNQGGLDITTSSNYIVLSDGDGNPRAYWNGANATFGGTLTATTITGTQVNSDNLRLDGNTLSSTDTNGNIVIAPNGTGQVQLSGALDVTNIEVTNIKSKDGTAALSIADSTGAVTIATALTANGGAVFNENGADVDFRVEGDTDANLIFADASTDRVGIGTNTPASKIHAFTTTDTIAIQVESSSTNAYPLFSIKNSGASGREYVITTGGSATGLPGALLIRDATAEANRLTITSGGQVNIGGNFTSTNNTLQVTGNAAIGYTTAAPTTGLIVAGNVGVGTDSPGGRLDIAGANGSGAINAYIRGGSSAGDYGILNINNGSTIRGRLVADATVDAFRIDTAGGASTPITFLTGSSYTERMRLDSSGNLGLGVTPSAWVSSVKAFDVGSAAASYYSGGVTHNAYFDATDSRWEYKGTGPATFYNVQGGTHAWSIAASGTAGNAITFTQAMTLDASGNLGVGTTSPDGRLQVSYANATTTQGNDGAGVVWLTNTNTTNNNWAQIFFTDSDGGAAAASFGVQYTDHANDYGEFSFATRGASGFAERARITSVGGFETRPVATGHAVFNEDGVDADFRVEGDTDANLIFADASTDRVGIGTNAPGVKLDIANASTFTGLRLIRTNNSSQLTLTIQSSTAIIESTGTGSNTLAFSTEGLEKARITSGGYFKASNNGTYFNSTGTYHELRQTANAQGVVVSATNASFTSESIFSTATKTAGTDWLHFYGTSDGNTVANIKIFGNGNVQNANNSYAGISDQKLKQDIVDAGSQWDDIKNLQVRKYRFKATPDAPLQIGLVAQEAETVSPGLVEETVDRDSEGNDLGTTTKAVKYSVLYMKAIKALQEAMARIEKLEAEVAALKGV
jgi:hypothetical protein